MMQYLVNCVIDSFTGPHHQVFHHLQCSFCKRSPDTLDAIVFTASGSEDKLCQYTFDNIEFIIIAIGINNNKKSSRKVHKPICCKQYTITYFKYFTAPCYVIKEVFYPGSCQPDRGNSHIWTPKMCWVICHFKLS